MSSISSVTDSDYWYKQYIKQLEADSSTSSAANGLPDMDSSTGVQSGSADFADILSTLTAETAQTENTVAAAASTDSSNSSSSQPDYLHNFEETMALMGAYCV